jgi:hypothetical protein
MHRFSINYHEDHRIENLHYSTVLKKITFDISMHTQYLSERIVTSLHKGKSRTDTAPKDTTQCVLVILGRWQHIYLITEPREVECGDGLQK